MTRLHVVILTLLAATAPSIAQGPPAPDLDRARELFGLLERLSEQDNGALWGQAVGGPMLLVEPSSREVVANERDRQGVLHEVEEGLYRGVLPQSVSIGNTTAKWNGVQWGMVQWPLPADEVYCGTLLMHESFHRVQPSLGIELAMPDNHHLDTKAGRVWLRLEFRALRAALECDDLTTCSAAHDAMLFREYRQRQFHDAREDERLLDMNEGLAEYTGIRLGGADAAQQRMLAARNLQMYDGVGVPLVRTFSYATGPAYGLMLDELTPGWTLKVRRRTDVARELRRALDWERPKELEEEALARANDYNYDELDAEETIRETARLDRIQMFREKFVDGPLLVLDLSRQYNFSFSPFNIEALEGFGTVYGTMTLTAPWGQINVTDGILVTPDGRKRKATVPAPTDPNVRPLTGEGWTLQLAPGWTVRATGRTRSYQLVKR